MRGDGVEVRRDRAPEAPVGCAQPRDLGGVHATVVVGRFVLVEEDHRVADVLLVQLDDLQLRQEQLGERHRLCVDLEPGLQRNLMAHPE